MEIREIIKRQDLEIIEGNASVADAIKKMVNRNVGSIIVKRSTPSKPYGIVTRQDILYKVVAKGLDPNALNIKDIMSSPVVILNNICLDIQYAAQAMENAGVTNLVIFDGGDVFGFLSSTDIIDAVAKDLVVKKLTSGANDVSGGC